MRNPLWIAAVLVIGVGAASFGHDSPAHVIELLTERIESEGENPSLLLRRSYEYRAMGDYEAAERDLSRIIEIDHYELAAYVALARVRWAQKDIEGADAAMRAGLEISAPEAERSELLAVGAEFKESEGEFDEALKLCEAALKARPGNLDWMLQRSRLQHFLGRHDVRIAGLREAVQRNPSIVLEIELTDALIDGGEHTEGLERVNRLAEGGRWSSAWRIRRARIYLGIGEKEAARTELEKALMEIEGRIAPARANPVLLIEQGTAQALLGKWAEAAGSLQEARDAGGDAWATRPLEALLK